MLSAYALSMSTVASQIRAILRTEKPIPSAAAIGRRLDCSRQLVQQVAKELGIRFPRFRAGPRPTLPFVARVSERVPGVRITSPNAGAAGELLVCADLMYRGWHVYRCVSPQAPCDIMAWKGETLLRIECRSGSRREGTGALVYAQPNDRIYDVLAISDLERRVEYRGPLAEVLNG